MTKIQKVFFVSTRIALGALFFYAGIVKVLDPSWSAAGYIGNAANFADYYKLALAPSVLPIINVLNAWGLTALGLSLIIGLFTRLSSILGAILMLLYYFALPFPYPNPHSLIVDEHIIYALILLFFASIPAGKVFGLDNKIWK